MALLAIKLIVKRNGKFISQHIHDNPALRKQKIHCVLEQDKEARKTIVAKHIDINGNKITNNKQ